jgi:hypothetical protein
MVLISGEEDALTRGHVLALNTRGTGVPRVDRTQQGRIDHIVADGGFAVIAHPDAARYLVSPERLQALSGYAGIEVFMESRATWEAVLAERAATGKPWEWGFMTDDSHDEAGRGSRFIMVRSPSATREAIVAAIKQGSFYWGSAALIEAIHVAGREVRITLSQEADIRFIISGGIVAAETQGRQASYRTSGGEGYVRIEVSSGPAALAGTQPFRVVGDGTLTNPYAAEGPWLKGNLHAHTTVSDGKDPPDKVAAWYREHGYAFLAITDHITTRGWGCGQ